MQLSNHQLNQSYSTVCANGRVFVSPTTESVSSSWDYLNYIFRW